MANVEEKTEVLKCWNEVTCDPAVAHTIAAHLNVPAPLGYVLAGRGIAGPKEAEQFLWPRLRNLTDPFEFPDMKKALVRIWDAIDAQESIVVFGDYDVDGVSSTALMVSFLSDLGAMATPMLPNRMNDGYGLTPEILRRLVDRLHPELLITVDCGTGAVDAVKLANEMGIDVVITDHHEPPAELAPALAIVNPKLANNEVVRMLAGVGVAFKVCHGLVKMARQQGRPEAENIDLKQYMDLVALGTVADIVPLVGENRILARHGLRELDTPRSLGLQTLKEVAGIREEVRAHHIGFQLGPRLNAAGRMGDAEAALELLLSEDATRARDLALRLDGANRERQDIENRMVREARTEIDSWFEPDLHFGVTISRIGWHPGVIGIVASRLSQHYYRPVIVIGMEERGLGRGSCRSIEGFDLVEHLDACSHLLVQYGGHNMAAGLEIKAANCEAFSELFNETAAEALAKEELLPIQRIDAWLELAEADEDLLLAQEGLRPFGNSNPTPVWAVRGVRVVRHRIVGNGHLQLTLAGGGVMADAIGFGLGDRPVPLGPIDVAFQLKRNNYQGRQSLRFDVQDFRASQ